MNIGFASGFSIMMFHGFINNVPLELEYAAAIDGCPRWKTFFVIVMPLVKSVYATVAVLQAMTLWNDYLLPSLTINKDGMQTLPLKTYLFFGQFAKRLGSGNSRSGNGNAPGDHILYCLSEVYNQRCYRRGG